MTFVVCIALLYCMCLHVAFTLQASSPFWNIVKSRRARDTREETRKRGGGGGLGEKGKRATITHKFSIPPGNLGTPQSVKTVTANVPQLIVFTTNGSSPQQLSLALSRASRFARPNGRAFSQDTLHIAFFIRKIEWSTLHGTLCKWHQI